MDDLLTKVSNQLLLTGVAVDVQERPKVPVEVEHAGLLLHREDNWLHRHRGTIGIVIYAYASAFQPSDLVPLALTVLLATIPAALVRITAWMAVRLIATGLVVGAVSGFFGIGGGFLVVPGLMLATGMPILNAIGSSLFSVGSFGLTTAINYALSGLIEWAIALLFIVGGVAGGYLGMRAAVSLAANRRSLTFVFAGIIFAVAIYMLARTGNPLWVR